MAVRLSAKRKKMEFLSSTSETQLLKKIGLKIHKDLFQNDKPVEWLAFESGVSRSTLREIIAGRSNLRLLTLYSITQGLGYESVSEFLDQI